MRIGKTRWIREIFPFISLLHSFLESHLFTPFSFKVSPLHAWHSHKLVSVFSYQASLLISMDGFHAHIWLQKLASVWNKSPDLATHTNNLDTAKWLLFAGGKMNTFSLECQMLKLGHVSDEFPFTMKVSCWAS